MKHLFKLKKDGEVSGYLKITDSIYFGWLPDQCNMKVGHPLRQDSKTRSVNFDTAHLFVTKDKNGNDVFADDPVWFHWMGKKSKAKVVKSDLFNKLVSCEGEVQCLPRTLCKSDIHHIELIEEQNVRRDQN